ncbi:hypothetical protein NKH89_23645 [Mesorhizobium sp. M0923]|uniref:hypothetical protein n=1 Tax=Mesorhizobium sp. M0923 TaxID=2957028 RepID=UPI003338D7CC
MMAVQDATRTIAAEQLVFSGPLLLACLAVAAPGRPRFTAVIVRAGAQFRLAHHWGGQIVSGVAINFVAAGSAIILGQVPAGRALGFLEAFRTFWITPQPELRVLVGQIRSLDSDLR